MVSYDEYDRRWLMTVDDGSGAVIDVVCEKEHPAASAPILGAGTGTPIAGSTSTGPVDAGRNVSGGNATNGIRNDTSHQQGTTQPSLNVPDMKGIDIGTIVKVKGTISHFRGVRQIELKRISMEPLYFPDLLGFYHPPCFCFVRAR